MQRVPSLMLSCRFTCEDYCNLHGKLWNRKSTCQTVRGDAAGFVFILNAVQRWWLLRLLQEHVVAAQLFVQVLVLHHGLCLQEALAGGGHRLHPARQGVPAGGDMRIWVQAPAAEGVVAEAAVQLQRSGGRHSAQRSLLKELFYQL